MVWGWASWVRFGTLLRGGKTADSQKEGVDGVGHKVDRYLFREVAHIRGKGGSEAEDDLAVVGIGKVLVS
jgi:hypothetical protein